MPPKIQDSVSKNEIAATGRDEPLSALLRQACEEKAPDVHLRVGSPPRLRIDGSLVQVKGLVPCTEMMRDFFQSMLTVEQYKHFERVLELDFSYDLAGICRMRVNLYQERGA